MEACPTVRYIGMLATGYDVVDVDCAREKGVVVANVPDYGSRAVAQFAIALLLELCHHIGSHDMTVHAGKWERCPDYCYWDYPLTELAGKTLGIIGYGRIGSRTGGIAQALGMNVIACNDVKGVKAVKTAVSPQAVPFVSFDTLLADSDCIARPLPTPKASSTRTR
jgi:glycerate dehydrogenase